MNIGWNYLYVGISLAHYLTEQWHNVQAKNKTNQNKSTSICNTSLWQSRQACMRVPVSNSLLLATVQRYKTCVDVLWGQTQRGVRSAWAQSLTLWELLFLVLELAEINGLSEPSGIIIENPGIMLCCDELFFGRSPSEGGGGGSVQIGVGGEESLCVWYQT